MRQAEIALSHAPTPSRRESRGGRGREMRCSGEAASHHHKLRGLASAGASATPRFSAARMICSRRRTCSQRAV